MMIYMTTKQTPSDANEAFRALEDLGGWATAEQVGTSTATLHWLTDKLWAERKELATDAKTGEALWAFRAR